jgi:hypothetical protein
MEMLILADLIDDDRNDAIYEPMSLHGRQS